MFTLVIKATVPTAGQPNEAAVFVGLNPSLRWEQSAATRQFQVQVAPFNNDGPAVNMIIGQSDLVRLARYSLAAPKLGVGNYILLPGMTYNWRVRTSPSDKPISEADAAWSEYTPWRTFRTGPPSSATVQPEFPVGGSQVASRIPQLRWSKRNDLVFYYEVQLSTDATFEADPSKATAAVFWELVHGGQTSPLNSYQVKAGYALESGARYYWRVRQRVQGDGTPVAWSETWSFNTP